MILIVSCKIIGDLQSIGTGIESKIDLPHLGLEFGILDLDSGLSIHKILPI